tara:strand:- start:5 stop:244 length:240 start_codon:yes stop_codon:yes gene_type:complete
MYLSKKELVKILIKTNSKLKFFNLKSKSNLIDDGLIDSFGIIQLVLELEKEYKIKTNIKNLNKSHFANIDTIHHFFNKK